MSASIRPAPSRGGYLFRDKVKWMLRRSSQLQEARKRHRVGHLRDCAKLRLHGWQMVNQNIEGFIKSIEDQGADYGFAKRETGRILAVTRSKIISPISTNQSARSSPLSQAGRVSLLKAHYWSIFCQGQHKPQLQGCVAEQRGTQPDRCGRCAESDRPQKGEQCQFEGHQEYEGAGWHCARH